MKSYKLITTYLLFVLFSCQNTSDDKQKVKLPKNRLSKKDITLKIGDTATLQVIKANPTLDISLFKIIPKNESNITVLKNENGYIKFVSEEEGSNVIYLVDETKIIDSCKVYLAKPNLIKVLAIGNSFSEDAVEFYLHDLLKEKKQDILIANAMIPACNLSTHINNLQNNLPFYSYRKINIFGEKKTIENQTLSTIINNEEWDYISFQQASPESGLVETFVTNLPSLYNQTYAINLNKNTKYLLHETWAYAPTSNHPGFVNYNRNQITMYNGIINSYMKAMKMIPATKIIPSGTAIQNARTSTLGNDLTRDGFHLNLTIGRYIVAGAWYEGLTGRSIFRNNYLPSGISTNDLLLSKKAIHYATVAPFKTTNIN